MTPNVLKKIMTKSKGSIGNPRPLPTAEVTAMAVSEKMMKTATYINIEQKNLLKPEEQIRTEGMKTTLGKISQ